MKVVILRWMYTSQLTNHSKLPPSPEQPIILAGLGTGAAPFRAFFQHLAWLAAQGQKIGPVYYYFGSRHQGSEYLYGEEIEAYIRDGVISKAGLAFSRDGPKKVYIQHKMLEDSKALVDMLYDQKGVFYLCGPTWPVPDVYEALINSLVNYKGIELAKAADYLEGLKEEERYVLEVRHFGPDPRTTTYSFHRYIDIMIFM
jgi:sulfite reductase (NADPH) flavoprotein alpha-component